MKGLEAGEGGGRGSVASAWARQGGGQLGRGGRVLPCCRGRRASSATRAAVRFKRGRTWLRYRHAPTCACVEARTTAAAEAGAATGTAGAAAAAAGARAGGPLMLHAEHTLQRTTVR
jgi:hypothetical protein